MSKELQALNDLRNSGLVKDDVVCFTKKALERRLDIIETELKENNELKTRNYELLKESEHFYNERNKYKQTLEIIKKEISDCLEFYYDKEHDYGEVWCIQNEEESRVLIASANSKEEFDLLKEVLL